MFLHGYTVTFERTNNRVVLLVDKPFAYKLKKKLDGDLFWMHISLCYILAFYSVLCKEFKKKWENFKGFLNFSVMAVYSTKEHLCDGATRTDLNLNWLPRGYKKKISGLAVDFLFLWRGTLTVHLLVDNVLVFCKICSYLANSSSSKRKKNLTSNNSSQFFI